jgi:Cupredoxin-like domain
MRRLLIASLLVVGFASPVYAEEYLLTLKNHQFTPQELTIPANTKVMITVKNEDSSSAEFESYDLNREKVISPNSSVKISVGPLDAGSYAFFDEFNQDTAKGTLIVK